MWFYRINAGGGNPSRTIIFHCGLSKPLQTHCEDRQTYSAQ